jgi:hypothetical protein
MDLLAIDKLVGFIGEDGLNNVTDDIWKTLTKHLEDNKTLLTLENAKEYS